MNYYVYTLKDPIKYKEYVDRRNVTRFKKKV